MNTHCPLSPSLFKPARFAADCRRLRPQRRAVPHPDGAVGHHGRSPLHVQRPALHQRRGPRHPAEQAGHRHQPGPAGHPGETHREGDASHSDFAPSQRLHVTAVDHTPTSVSPPPDRRRTASRCSGEPSPTAPALWFSSAAAPTCRTAT